MGNGNIENTGSSGEVGKLRDYFENIGKQEHEKDKAVDNKSRAVGKNTLVSESSSKEAPIVKVSKEAKLEVKKALVDSDISLKQTEETAKHIVSLASSATKRALPQPRSGPPDKSLPSTPVPTRGLPLTPKQQAITETLAKITKLKTKDNLINEFKENREKRVLEGADQRVSMLFQEEFNKIDAFISKDLRSGEKLEDLELDLQKIIHSDSYPEKTETKEKMSSIQDFDAELKKMQLDSKKEMLGKLRNIQDQIRKEATGTSGRYLETKDKAFTQIGTELGRLSAEIAKLEVKSEIKSERTEKTIQAEIDSLAEEIESKELSIEGYLPDLKFTEELIAEIKETIANSTEELKYERDGLARRELREDIADAKDELEDELKTLKVIQEDIADYNSEISQLKEKIVLLEKEIKDLK